MSSTMSSTLASGWIRLVGEFESASLAKIAIPGVIGIWLIQSIIRRIWFAYATTLRRVPGPLHARLCGWALNWNDVCGSRWYYVQALHKKYGPIVLIAPDEVAISDPEVVRKVHTFGTEFRKRRQPGTADNIFSMADPKLHRTRQRFYSGVFSPETLKSSTEPAVRQLAKMATAGIEQDAAKNGSRVVDMFKWCMLFGNDVAFQVVYGHTDALMAHGESNDKVIMGWYLQRMMSWAKFCFPVFLIGHWLSPLSPTLRELFCLNPIYRDLWEEGDRQREIARKTVFVQTTKFSKEEGRFRVSDEVSLSDFEIAHDITTFLGAGAEAVGATLVFLLWEVLRTPTLQEELVNEVAELTEPITDEQTSQLPILNGVIYEALRLYGGGATHLPRYAPTATELGGYIIPPGTAVTSHACALHRNPAAWDDPETFDYRRWLSQSESKAMIQDKFQPFSSGARACIAINLVRIEMRLFVATFFREFAGTTLARSTTDKSMRISDRFHCAPKSYRCEVVIPETKASGS